MKNSTLSRWLIVLLAVVLLGATGCSKQAKAKRHLTRADKYLAANDYEKAEIEYINVLRLQPTNTPAARNLAQIYYEDEMLQNAAVLLSRLRQVNTNDIDTRAKLSRIYLGAGAPKQARAEAEFVLKHSSTNEEALLTYVDTSIQPAEIEQAKKLVAALRQKSGDSALLRVASGYLAMREKNAVAAEAELKAAIAMDPKSSLAHWALGNLYFAQGKRELAEPELKTAVDLSPIRSPRRLRYAALRAQARDIEGANAILSEMTTKAPDYLPAWLYSARLALDQKQFDKSEANINRILRRNGNHFEAMALRGELYVAQNKVDKALKELERLVLVYPKSVPAHYQLASTAIAAKDFTRGRSALDQALNLDPKYTPAVLLLAELNLRTGEASKSITLLTDLLRRDTNNYRAFILLGAAYRGSGRPADAVATYARASRAFPTSLEAAFLLGDSLREQGRLDDARKVFEGILQTKPDDVPTNAQLVAIDIAERKFDTAIQRVEKWIERAPKDPEPVFQMAKLRFAQRDFKSAQALLEKVIAMNPDAISAYTTLARIYYDTQQVDDALQKCADALSRNPNDTTALLMAGIISDEKRDYAKAREYYEKLLAIAPTHVVALNNVAVIYAERLNDLEKAHAAARKAEELRPNDPSIADTFGWILSQRGEYSVALGFLTKAAQARPAEPDIAAHFGITQYMLGDEASARATLIRALQNTNQFSARAQAEECMAILNINAANADAAAVAVLEKRLAEQPADPAALSRLATIYERSGKVDKAVALYEKAVAANPKFALAVARLADLTDRQLNDSSKALELAKNARRLDAEDPQVAHLAGRVASRSTDIKDMEWSLGLLQEVSRKQPGDPSISYDLGWAYYTQGRLAEAETALKLAGAGDANLPSVVAARRALEFLPLADPARAAQQVARIDQALQADANYLPALAARAALAQQSGDTNAALKTLDQIITRYPAFGPAIRSYAILGATQSSDTAKALAVATRASDLFPNDSQVAKALGIAQYRRGEYQKAAQTLNTVARKEPNDETVQFYLGMAHYQLKQARESKAALKKAIELQPKAPFLAEAQRILAELK